MRRVLLSFCLMVAGFALPCAAAESKKLQEPLFLGVFESQHDRIDANGHTELDRVPGYLSILEIASINPDTVYPGGAPYTIDGTGMTFAYPAAGDTLRKAVQRLHTRHPKMRVVVSVAAPEESWSHLNPQAIRRFVDDFGLNGVDIDFETLNPACKENGEGEASCASDKLITEVIRKLRAALPRPYLLSLDVEHVGAYTSRRWPEEYVAASRYNGFNRQPLIKAGRDLDFINLIAYNTGNGPRSGNGFHPLQAAAAYKEIFHGPVLISVQPAPESWGDHVYSVGQVLALATEVVKQHTGGMMLSTLQRASIPGKHTPDSAALAFTICTVFNLGNCNAPLPTGYTSSP